MNVSSSEHYIHMYSPDKSGWVMWKSGSTMKLQDMKNTLFSSTFADATSTKFVSARTGGDAIDHTNATNLPYSLSAFNGVSDTRDLYYHAGTQPTNGARKTYFLTGSAPGGSYEPNTLYLDDGSDALSANDKPVRFDFTINDKETQTTNYSGGATADYTKDDAKNPEG